MALKRIKQINPANFISVFRIFLVFVAVYLLVEDGGKNGTLVAASIIALAVMLDAVDGMVARTFGFEGEVGKISDLYADHIVANVIWVTLAFIGLVPVWVPLITTTRDFAVDWLRQAGSFCTGLNGFEQVEESHFHWLVSSRWMRASYGVLKLASWGLALASIFLPIGAIFPIVVWMTVVVCLLRAFPAFSASWKYVLLTRPVG